MLNPLGLPLVSASALPCAEARGRGRGFGPCIAVGAAVAMTLAAHSAWAQDAAGSGSQPATHLQLQEIVVTAERRTESAERTPLAITALSGSMLGTLGVTRATDLTGLVPDVHIGDSGIGAQIAIRGVVSTNDTEVGDPAVAFNVDGVYLARSRSALGSMFDIKRIEVLRGPQGTLYGRNATAGAINVITNSPDMSRAYGTAAVEFGNYNELQTSGVANIPVTGTFGLRAAFQTDRHGGYSNNEPARPYNDLDSSAGRVEALWEPLSQLSALLTVDYYHDGGAGDGGYGATAPLGTYAAGTAAGPYRYAVSRDGYNDETAEGTTLTVNWTLPLATVTYVGNYRSDDWHSLAGATATGPTGPSCQSALAPDCTTATFSSLDHQTSHELRLSHNTSSLNWVAGLYYFKEHNNVFLGISPLAGINALAFVQPIVLEESKAAFGQITWSLTRRLRLIGGLRYNEDHKGRTGATDAFGSIVGEGCAGCLPLYDNYASLDWHKLTWKGGLDFDLNRGSMLFATVATGYKAGGYGDGVPPNNHPYNPETIRAYEAGSKNVLAHGRLQLNVDVFYDLYSNYQASAAALVGGQQSLVTENAGSATIDGIEIETAALITPHDRLNFSASYLHAYFTQFYLPLGDAFNTGPVSYAGNTLPNAPHVTVHLGYQHVFPLPGGAALVPRIDTGWTDRQNLDYHNYAVTEQGSYTRTDLTLSYEAPKVWRLMLYARNVENKAVLSTAMPDARVGATAIGRDSGFGIYMPPRTYGVQLSASF